MKWSREAEQAVSRVPFFVRKRVRARVEEEAERAGARQVGLEHVRASQKRFLERMQDEVRGYQVETCFGPGGCKHRAVVDDDMADMNLSTEGFSWLMRTIVGLADKYAGGRLISVLEGGYCLKRLPELAGNHGDILLNGGA